MREIVWLETQRLKMRPILLDDVEDLYKLNLDPDVVKYTGDVPFESIETCHKFYNAYDQYEKFGMGRFSVFRKRDNQFIGWCGLKLNESSEIDLGYRFFKSEWNKGYATESSIASLNYGFEKLKLERIVAHAYKVNMASIKVMEKVGMRYVKDLIYDGHACVMYAMSCKEYEDFIK